MGIMDLESRLSSSRKWTYSQGNIISSNPISTMLFIIGEIAGDYISLTEIQARLEPEPRSAL